MASISRSAPPAMVTTRPERPDDADFRFGLFLASRPDDWSRLPIEPAMLDLLMRQQFQAQTAGYAAQFPDAACDIVEAGGAPIGRMVVDRTSKAVHLIDIALTQAWRGLGVGSALVAALLDEADGAGLPVVLQVARGNEAALRFYGRLGFEVTGESAMHLDLGRPAASDSTTLRQPDCETGPSGPEK